MLVRANLAIWLCQRLAEAVTFLWCADQVSLSSIISPRYLHVVLGFIICGAEGVGKDVSVRVSGKSREEQAADLGWMKWSSAVFESSNGEL